MVRDGRSTNNIKVDATRLGKAFWKRFQRDHPDLVLRKFRSTETSRKRAEKLYTAQHYAKTLGTFLAEFRNDQGNLKLRDDQFHNLDESGIDLTANVKTCLAEKDPNLLHEMLPTGWIIVLSFVLLQETEHLDALF